MDTLNALKNSFLQSTITPDMNIAVRAEDVQVNSGIDFTKHFFEPQIGKSYVIKFLPNPNGEPIVHRQVYKNLPDPERKGKTFHYTSSGNAKTCTVLDLFFDLNKLKKDGDAVAEKKIDKYLGKTNQACCKIEVLSSPVPEEIGIIRMFTFSTFGPNATIANLINQKLNPTKEQMTQGYEKEDIFNIFGSDVLSLICEESTYGEGQKGRDFSKSGWVPKKQRGAIVKLENGDTHEFSAKDVVEGEFVAEVNPFFEAFVAQITNADYDIHNFFAYKEIDDEKNTKETNDYLKILKAKVEEIIPIIREKSLSEIASYGKKEAAPTAGSGPADTSKNVLAESIPEELKGTILGKENEAAAIEKKSDKPASADEAESILNGD